MVAGFIFPDHIYNIRGVMIISIFPPQNNYNGRDVMPCNPNPNTNPNVKEIFVKGSKIRPN